MRKVRVGNVNGSGMIDRGSGKGKEKCKKKDGIDMTRR